MLEEYTQQHDGWYPRGGQTPLDSLAMCVRSTKDVGQFTSHALNKKHWKHWNDHRTFSPKFCCYRYNEGLRKDDPPGLILLYYCEPTRWECNEHKKDIVGRPVSFHPPGHSWDFIPEAEFQQKQRQTIDFLREHGRTEYRAHNKPVQRTGASRFAQSEMRTSSAAGSRR
jgi:hypothetical protein